MKNSRNEMLRMRKLMLHEVGVSELEWTPNKKLILEGATNPSKIIDALSGIFTASGKNLNAKQMDDLGEAIVRGTAFDKIAYSTEALVENLYKLVDDAPDVIRLGDDLTNSVRNNMNDYIKKNNLFKVG